MYPQIQLALYLLLVFASSCLQGQQALVYRNRAYEAEKELGDREESQKFYEKAYKAYLLEKDTVEALPCFYIHYSFLYISNQKERYQAALTEFEALQAKAQSKQVETMYKYTALSVKRLDIGDKQALDALEQEIYEHISSLEPTVLKADILFLELIHLRGRKTYRQEDSYLSLALSLYKEHGLWDSYKALRLRAEQLALSRSYAEASFKIPMSDWPSAIARLRREVEKLENPLERNYLQEVLHYLNVEQAYVSKKMNLIQKAFDEQEPFLKAKKEGITKQYHLANFYSNKALVYKEVFIPQLLETDRQAALAYARDAIAFTQQSAQFQENLPFAKRPYELFSLIAKQATISELFMGVLSSPSSSDSAEYYAYQAYKYTLPEATWPSFDGQSLAIPDSFVQQARDKYQLQYVIWVARALSYAYLYAIKQGKNSQDKFRRINRMRKEALAAWAKFLEDEASHTEYRSELAFYYKDMQGFYAFLYKSTGMRIYADSAIQHIELAVASDTREKLNKEELLQKMQVPKKEIEQYLQLKKDLAESESKKKRAVQTGKSQDLEVANKEFNEQLQTLDAFDRTLQKNYPKYGQYFQESELFSLDGLQQSLTEKQLLVLSAMEPYLFLLSRDSIWLVEDYPRASQDDLRRFSHMLSTAKSLDKAETRNWYQSWAHEQFQGLFPKHALWQELGLSDLLVLNSGYLQAYPLDFLLTQPSTETQSLRELPYLLKSYSLQYLPSLSLWLRAKQQKKREALYSGILGFAPSYTMQAKEEQTTELQTLRKSLSPLVGAKKELEALQGRYGGSYYFGELAQESLFKDLLVQKPHSIVHLAMHGLLDSKDPSRSSLAFSESLDSLDDGFLYVHELAALDIQAELFVLSACETGIGEAQTMEGPLSIARYIFYAGVPASLATRWQVNDASTAWIMKRFYLYLEEELSITEALRRAQLDFLEQAPEEAAHPFYWGPYMSMGYTDRPLNPYKKGAFYKSLWFWALLSSVFLALFVFVYRRKQLRKGL